MPAIPVISAAAGVYSVVDGADKARKAANAASDQAKAAAAGTGGGTVNIANLDQQARDLARKNAADSAALEAQYNPGAGALRAGSLEALMAALNNPNTTTDNLAARIGAQAGAVPTGIGYDSPLTRQAIEAASRDLSLGGALPQDVRNLVVQNALERSGNVTGKLDLGRDLSTRDLGLTSLDLYNKRLANAAALGQQEAALGQGNAGLSLQAQLAGTNNLFNSANFLQSIDSGTFAQALAAAQFGQNIAQPMSGLDPGSVVNLAVGNSNVAANAADRANAVAAGAANQKTALGANLLGTGLGFYQQYLNSKKPVVAGVPTTYTSPAGAPPASTYDYNLGTFCWVAREVFGEDSPEWTQFRDWMLSKGSPELVDFYGQNGEAIAAQIKDQPEVKTLIKHLMLAAKGGA